MKTFFVCHAISAFAVSAFAQGALIAIDNNNNSNPSLTATSGGLFFLQYQLINQDFNLALYGGTDSTALTLIHSFTGSAAQGVTAAGPGTFTDLSGGTYAVPGTTT